MRSTLCLGLALLTTVAAALATETFDGKSRKDWMNVVDRELQLERDRKVPILRDIAGESGAGMARYPIAISIADLFWTVPASEFDAYLESLHKGAACSAILDSWKNAERVARETHKTGFRSTYVSDGVRIELAWFEEPLLKPIRTPETK